MSTAFSIQQSNRLKGDRSIVDVRVKRSKQGAMQERSQGDAAGPSSEPLSESPPRCPSLVSQESLKPTKYDTEVKKCLGEESFEVILKSYSCAWQRDILVHGRLYITESWVCFYSNILGWETKTRIRLNDVTNITKQKTAKVFPNAILIETDDRKYGFASIYHRDKAYLVLLTVWNNALQPQPLSGDCLMNEVKTLKVSKSQEEFLLSGKSPKPISFIPEEPDIDTSHQNTPQFVQRHTSGSESTAHTSEDRTTTTTDTNMDQLDGADSSFSSSSGSDKEGHSLATESCSSETEWMPNTQPAPLVNDMREPPSLVNDTRKPTSLVPTDTRGGSPNWIHHWKANISKNFFYQKILKLLSPQVLLRSCSPAVFINILILIFIGLLLLMTLSMVCYISQVEPALQPYLKWQPWCWLCSHDNPADIELSMLRRVILSNIEQSTEGTSSSPSLAQPP